MEDNLFQKKGLDWLIPLLIFLILHDGCAWGCRFLIHNLTAEKSFWQENQILLESAAGNITAIPFLLYWIRKFPQNALISGKKSWIFWSIAVGICSCVSFNGFLICSGLTQLFANDYQQTTETLYSGSMAVSILFVAVIAPIAEELLYRGILYRQIRERRGVWRAALFSSLFFGIAHMAIVQGIYGFFTGMVLCHSYEYKKGIKSAITVHMVMNLTSILITQMSRIVQFQSDYLIFITAFIVSTLILIFKLVRTR